MKKILLSFTLAFCSIYLFAQDEGVIQLLATQKKWEEAKTQVDKWVSNPKLKDKDKATANLWKLNIYSQLSVDSSLSSKYPDAADQAMAGFTAYQAIDPSLKQLKEQGFASGLGNLYSGSFDKGRAAFNVKDWTTAYKNFAQAQMLGDFLIANKLSTSTSTLDTVTVLYTGYSAQNVASMDSSATGKTYQDSAAKNYSRLADARLNAPEYVDIYKYLINYYSDKKDDANFKKYLAEAKELYPNDNTTWTQFEMGNMTTNSDLPTLLQNYQKDAAAGSMSEDKYATYAEAFATNDKAQLDKLDSTQKTNIKLAAAQAFSKAFELNGKNGLYAFNTGVIYYSIYGELDDRYNASRGESAALKAKRADIAKQEAGYADTSSQWLQKAYNILKVKTDRTKSETTSLNRTVDYLAVIYDWERNQTKVNGNSKDYDKYDALFKQYDAEHGSYK